MKYVALWFLSIAVVALVGLVIAAAYSTYMAVSQDPRLWWVPILVVAATAIATVAATLDYLSDHRTPKDPTL